MNASVVTALRRDRAGIILGAERTKHSVGWICGVIVFWALTAWLIVVGLSSIIPQIFWPAQAAAGASRGCAEALTALEHELLAHAASNVENPEDSRVASADGADTQWFVAFDERLKNTQPQCTAEQRAAFDELVRVRHTLAAFIERFQREEAPRLLRFEQLLGDRVHGAPTQ